MNKRLDKNITLFFISPAFIIVFLIVFFPLALSLYFSFTDYVLLEKDTGKLIGLNNYFNLINDQIFYRVLLNTVIIMSIAINVEFLLGLGLAVLVNRNFKGQKLYRTIILTPMMISPAVVGLNFKFLFNDLFGLFNNLLFLFRLIDKPIAWLIDPALAIFSIIITDIWQYTPFMMLILYAGLQALPREPYEAALVDGASSWQIFTKITIPLLRPVILIALTIRSLDIARLFDIIMIMTGGGPAHRTEVMGTYVFRLAIQDRMFGYGNAMAYISILITIAFVAYLFKQLKATKLER